MSSGPRYLVVSDLHVQSGKADSTSGSTIFVDEPGADEIFERCSSAILSRFDEVDGILVAGDMVNKADTAALAWTWRQLHSMGAALNAPIYATAGNHDLDSRGKGAPLPQDALMDLAPTFPFGDSTTRAKYFAEQHAVTITSTTLIVSINSCAHHGYSFKGEPELEHGRVTAAAAKWLQNSLNELGELPKYKVLIMHHHPVQLPDFDTDETSTMQGAELLMRVLSQFGDWLIVHGHKHRGWVYYAAGSGDAPVVLSSSSFGANLGSDDFGRIARRQFHLVEFHDSAGPRGLVHTWTHDGVEWIEAGGGHMLSGQSGFGWKTSLLGLADRLRSQTLANDGVSKEELLALEPNIPYLSHDDRDRLSKFLKNHDSPVAVLRESDGNIRELQPIFETELA